jgi:hypothetical protein
MLRNLGWGSSAAKGENFPELQSNTQSAVHLWPRALLYISVRLTYSVCALHDDTCGKSNEKDTRPTLSALIQTQECMQTNALCLYSVQGLHN